MRKIFLGMAALLFAGIMHAQNSFRATIKCAHHKEPLSGATVTIEKLGRTAVADSTGTVVISNIPAGKFIVKVTYVGRPDFEQEYAFPLPSTDAVDIFMEEEEEEE